MDNFDWDSIAEELIDARIALLEEKYRGADLTKSLARIQTAMARAVAALTIDDAMEKARG